MKIALLTFALAVLAYSQNTPKQPDTFVGTFDNDKGSLELKPGANGLYNGTLTKASRSIQVGTDKPV